MVNLSRTYHSAQWLSEPVLKPERDWEVWHWAGAAAEGYYGIATPFSGGVWYDVLTLEYRLYYRCGQTQCVALSHDGLKWRRPELDIVNGTNIVVQGADAAGATVWLDHGSRATEPDAGRWKMALIGRPGDGQSYSLLTSHDGFHFNYSGSTGPTIDRSSFFYNPFRQRWVFSMKQETHMCGRPTNHTFEALLTRTRRYAEVPRGSFLGSRACPRNTSDGCIGATGWTSCPSRALCNNGSTGIAVNWIWSDMTDPLAQTQDHRSQLYNLDIVAYESLFIGFFSLITAKDTKPPRPFGRAGEQDAVW
jgi:hypothetical protein